jgi:hypothetical protein
VTRRENSYPTCTSKTCPVRYLPSSSLKNSVPPTDREICQIVWLMTGKEKNEMMGNVLPLLVEGKPFPATTEGRLMEELVRQIEARQPEPDLPQSKSACCKLFLGGMICPNCTGCRTTTCRHQDSSRMWGMRSASHTSAVQSLTKMPQRLGKKIEKASGKGNAENYSREQFSAIIEIAQPLAWR